MWLINPQHLTALIRPEGSALLLQPISASMILVLYDRGYDADNENINHLV